ncbi:MAG: hypothetical protein KYX69_05655 [Sphingomonas sp.]|uniref:hypothetical protein n=1 Tax=Sphingomonas sp. TaxID=28214 RepID=UPI0026242933|nr:hypothetical protein [Sphingomonas sp.]MDK2767187.1 hypothetical protein [Sphingomonas sp.]
MRLLLAIPLILAPALALAQPCPGYSASGRTSFADLDRFYGERAVAILRAAMMRDHAELDALVTADATIELWRGDASWAPRGADRKRVSGGGAVMALTERLKPRAFTLLLEQPGPISIENPDKCERAVRLIITMTEPGQAASLDFAFRDGKLASVTGEQKGLVEGTLPQ